MSVQQAAILRALDTRRTGGRYCGARFAQILVVTDARAWLRWAQQQLDGEEAESAAILLEHLDLERAA